MVKVEKNIASAVEDLRLRCRHVRDQRGLSLRAAAREVGISFSTLDRFELSTVDAQVKTVCLIEQWADQRGGLS